MHLLCISDPLLSDCRPSRSLQNPFNGVTLISVEVCKNNLSCLFAQKPQGVVNQIGTYII